MVTAQYGESLTGKDVWMPAGGGSSSSAAVLAESVHSGREPAALRLGHYDTILVSTLSSRRKMYDVMLPVGEPSSTESTHLTTGRKTPRPAAPMGETRPSGTAHRRFPT